MQRGEAHERTVLERFRADGRSGRGDQPAPERGAAAAQATREAIRGGADVIYQGVLLAATAGPRTAASRRCWGGRTSWSAPTCSPRRRGAAPGGLHYEVVDAKLARTAKARAVAQTAFYSHLLAELQGVRPRWMHLALGTGRARPFKVGDYAAYERQARRALGAFIAADPGDNPPADPYPEPVEHCAICRWDELCAGPQAARRRPVAGRRDHQGPAPGAEGRRGIDPARVRRPGRAARP